MNRNYNKKVPSSWAALNYGKEKTQIYSDSEIFERKFGTKIIDAEIEKEKKENYTVYGILLFVVLIAFILFLPFII